MARHALANVIVDRRHDVLRFAGQTGRYLEPANGVATLKLFNLLRMELHTAVRIALAQAARTGTPCAVEGVDVLEAIGPGRLTSSSSRSVPRDPTSSCYRMPGGTRVLKLPGARPRDLRAAAKRRHCASSSAELEAANEELQSSNEELETLKEELQALNEELQTINAELSHRNDSLVRSNSDLANLFESTSIATLFLDKDLRIRRFTPRLLDIFKVGEGDEGRPISDIVSRRARDGGLAEDVRKVLLTLAPIEREVEGIAGKTYLIRVQPYRDMNNVVGGAVVIFIDISERKQHELARSRLAGIADTSQDAIVSQGLGRIDHELERRGGTPVRISSRAGRRTTRDGDARRRVAPTTGPKSCNACRTGSPSPLSTEP